MATKNAVFHIDYDERWDCYVATHNEYIGIVGTADHAWMALNDLLKRINDNDGREVYAVVGGWTCSHKSCACTGSDGVRLAAGGEHHA